MKITVRLLKGDAFELEVEPQDTVECVKRKVSNVRAELGNIEMQKLIWNGKVLVNEQTVESYGIQDNDVLVAMATKPKPEKPAESKPAGPPKPPPPVAPVPKATAPQHEAAFVTSSGAEETIKQLCEMGFEREQVQKCLRAAFNNPDRAFEYLMSGIPDSVLDPAGENVVSPPAAVGTAPGQTPGEPTPAGTTPFPAMPTAATSGGAQPFPAMNPAAGSPPPGTFDALRNHPQFAELARMVTQNPQMLGQILPVLEQTNPQVMQEIHNNPDQFMRLLQESASGVQQGDAVTNMLAAAQAAGGVGGDGMPGMGMPGLPGGQTIVQLSREEADAIDRLQQLGFDRTLAVEAYFACDKNEELAANYLFENMGD